MDIPKRIYFDRVDGNVFFETNEMLDVMGISKPTIEDDIRTFKVLSDRNRETFDVIELPIGGYVEDFREGRLIGVDLEKRIPIFEYSNPQNPNSPFVPDKPLSVKVQELEIAQAQTNTSLLELMELVVLGGN